MPIQKFKFGQEITSAKLNEIVSFVNNLEAFSNNAQFWNENIDSKIAGFQTQLNNIVNEIKSLLDTAENFDALLTAFVDLKNQYEALVAENVEALLENLFNPQSFFINPNGFVVIGGVVTSTQLTAIPGPQGATGATGATGSNGSNGKTIITNTGVPNNNTGTNGDVYFDVNNFDFYLKANDVWGLIGNTKGPQGSIGPQGASAQILFRYQTEAGLAYLSEPPASALVKFMEFKVIYSNETNQQIELKPWVRLQVRNDRFFPVQVPDADPKKVILSWSATEGNWPENGLNIRGDDGEDGENGLNGTNGTSVNIKGGFDDYEDLEDITSPSLGDGYLIEGDLWVYTGGTANSSTPLPPDLGSIVDGFLNAGSIQGPTGPAPVVQAEVVANLNPNESASVSVVNPSQGTYKLNFSIPRGVTGTRGSLIFNVNTVNDLPTGESWEGNTLRVNDLFIVNTTGGIYRITQTSPWVAPALIYSAAASNHAHGNITNVGAIGTTADQVVVTGTDGVLNTSSRSGIDSRSTFTPSSHTHGNITNAGAIGGISGLPIITTTSGVLTTGSFGTTSGTFTQGNDARLSDARTPTSHLHGNITNGGAIGTTADQVVVTGTDGVLNTSSRSGIDSRTAFPTTYANITGTVPTWNQDTTGNARTVTVVNAGPTETNYVLFYGGGTSSPKIDQAFTYNGQAAVLFAPYFSGSLWNPVTFNNSGLGVASGTSYNAGTPITISYNTLGAAASSHTHSLSDITNLQRSYVSSDSTTAASFKQIGTFTLTQNKVYKIKISGMYTRSAGAGGSYGINLALYSSINGVSALNGEFTTFRTSISVGSISTTLGTTLTQYLLSEVNTSTNGKLSFNLEGTVTTTGGTPSTFFIGFLVTGATGNTVGVENVVMQAELLN
jgi:hypothetical protein